MIIETDSLSLSRARFPLERSARAICICFRWSRCPLERVPLSVSKSITSVAHRSLSRREIDDLRKQSLFEVISPRKSLDQTNVRAVDKKIRFPFWIDPLNFNRIKSICDTFSMRIEQFRFLTIFSYLQRAIVPPPPLPPLKHISVK